MNVVLRENQQGLRQRRLQILHNGEVNVMAYSFDIVRMIKSKSTVYLRCVTYMKEIRNYS
jgi:hypothetical protein